MEHNDEDERALCCFLQDIDCLNDLPDWAHGFNAFDVLGITRMEIKHSNMLAWLLDPNGGHGLGDEFIKAMLALIVERGSFNIRTLEALIIDYQGFKVRREWQNIDIFAYSEDAKIALCIENKIDSGEHGNQLENYRTIVKQQFADRGYRVAYAYLTPDGEDSSDPDVWASISYGDVLDALSGAREKVAIPAEAAYLIDDYVEIVRRHIVGDEELRRICEQIYHKHSRALDLIYENRPDKVSELASMFTAWAKSKDDGGFIEFDEATSTKKFTRFKTKAMSAILPDSDAPTSGWKTANHYFYEILSEGDKYFMKLSFSLRNMSDEQRAIVGDIAKALGQTPPANNRAWWTAYAVKPRAEVPEEVIEDEVFAKLDSWLKTIQRKEAELSAKLH